MRNQQKEKTVFTVLIRLFREKKEQLLQQFLMLKWSKTDQKQELFYHLK